MRKEAQDTDLCVEEADEDAVAAIVLGCEGAHAREVGDSAMQPTGQDVLETGLSSRSQHECAGGGEVSECGRTRRTWAPAARAGGAGCVTA